jgi:hypothetical protein
MTDEQINKAIALHLGWTGVVSDSVLGVMGIPPLRNECDIVHVHRAIWSKDLNAMHEAEKTLTKEQVREYQTYMYDMACEIDNTCGRWMPYSATAAYRAEAFLKTLGKWEEAE